PIFMRRMRATIRAKALASFSRCSQAEKSAVWRTSAMKRQCSLWATVRHDGALASKPLGQVLAPLRPHPVVERLAGARDLRERLLTPERHAGVDHDARIAPVFLGVVAHRVERRAPASMDDVDL